MGALRGRMIKEMKLRNFSAATQKSYVYAVTRLENTITKHPTSSARKISEPFSCIW